MQTETSEQVTESGDKTCEEEVQANEELMCELEVQVIKICFFKWYFLPSLSFLRFREMP